jgi:hypothetical protein
MLKTLITAGLSTLLPATAVAAGWTCDFYEDGQLRGQMRVDGEVGASTMDVFYEALDGMTMRGKATHVEVCKYWDMTMTTPSGTEAAYSCLQDDCESATCYAHAAPFSLDFLNCKLRGW